jgi:hypothetical protein
MYKYLLFLLLIIPAQAQYDVYDILNDSTRVNKICFGAYLDVDYDVNLYRDSADILKTDDIFEALSYRVGSIEVISASRVLSNITLPDINYTSAWNGNFAPASMDAVYDKIETLTTSTKVNEFSSSRIWIRDNIFEEYWTNGNAALAFNWTGYNHGTTQFRDAVFYDGKNNEIVTFDGSTHESIFNGNIVLGGNDISGDDFAFDDGIADAVTFNSATIGRLNMTSWISSAADIDIRPASGYNVVFNWQNSGGDIIQYNNTTMVAKIEETGAIWSASTGSFGGAVTIPADAYGSGWNGKQEAAPKDAVYDKIESLSFTPAFSALTGGTNTTAAMVVGSGASLSYTGTGSINASQYQGNTTVSATEFGYLDGVTSAIQTQINSKAGTSNPLFSGVMSFSAQADIRAAAGQSVALNYSQGADALYFYGGGTGVRFSVVNGAGYLASTMDATGYKVSGTAYKLANWGTASATAVSSFTAVKERVMTLSDGSTITVFTKD